MKDTLQVQLADKEGLRWCQDQVMNHHYLRTPVDPRCSPVAHQVLLDGSPVGCLIYGRPEATRCYRWYGSVEDTQRDPEDPHYCPLTRWQILNLARVWLDPMIQVGGACYIQNAATWIIAQSLRRIVVDYLLCRAVVWPEEPYEIREVLSYCDRRVHSGALYRAANFALRRTNGSGIETYARPVRRLTHAEHTHIKMYSQRDKRARRLRAERSVVQLPLLSTAL